MTTMIVNNSFPIDVYDLSFTQIDTVVTATAGSFIYESPDGNTIEIWGSDFTYDEFGQPVAGDVSVIVMRDNFGNEIASFTLADADLGALLASGGGNFWEVLFAGDDALFGHDGNDTVSGHAGNDMIDGDGGNDYLLGGIGNDTLAGGTGNDSIHAGDDNDTIVFHAAQGNDTIDGGNDVDTLVFEGLNSAKVAEVIVLGGLRRSDEWLQLEAGSEGARKVGGLPETQALLRNIEFVEINGNAGDDALHVFSLSNNASPIGSILFDGGQGTDDLHAEFTTTRIEYVWRFTGDGHPGDGSVDFGLAFDTFHVIAEVDDEDLDLFVAGGLGIVEVSEGLFGGGPTGTVQMTNVEHLDFDLAGGNDTVTINGSLGAEFSGFLTIDFGDGINTLEAEDYAFSLIAGGGNGTDTFESGDGADILNGGGGGDFLFGGAGNDTLEGGTGDDQMDGGADADRFIFEAGFGNDTINNFEAGPAGDDVLDLSALGFSFLPGSDLAINGLAITQDGPDTVLTTATGDSIRLTGVLTGDLDSGDFLL